MAAQLRLVRRRISSVQSIAKITRAQELIASSRIVRAQQEMRAAEPYSRELTRAVEAVISRSSNITHPFTEEPQNPSRAAVLILTSDQGFAGAYNSNVLREAARLRQRLRDRNIEPVLYVAGRKGIGWHRFRELDLADSWSGFSAAPRYRNAQEISDVLLEAFNSGEGGVDEVIDAAALQAFGEFYGEIGGSFRHTLAAIAASVEHAADVGVDRVQESEARYGITKWRAQRS